MELSVAMSNSRAPRLHDGRLQLKKSVAALAIFLIATVNSFAIPVAPLQVYRITSPDMGGFIVPYLHKYYGFYKDGTHVAIDSLCASACTTVLMLPKDRICITPRARLGFHSAYELLPFFYSRTGTQYMRQYWPPAILKLLAARGWDGSTPHPDIIWIDYLDLHQIYPDCGVGEPHPS
jgi:hypothetical protein